MILVNRELLLEPLHAHPRSRDFLRRVGLPDVLLQRFREKRVSTYGGFLRLCNLERLNFSRATRRCRNRPCGWSR